MFIYTRIPLEMSFTLTMTLPTVVAQNHFLGH